MLTTTQFIAQYPALARLCNATPVATVQWYDHKSAGLAEFFAAKIPANRVEEFQLESDDPLVAVLAPTVGLTEVQVNMILNVCETMSGK